MSTADTVIGEIAQRARTSGRLAIDTEFVGEGRYQPLLCLIQVALPDSEVILLDPIAKPFDPAPLAAVLADPEIEVVLHAARQDVGLLRRDWDEPLRAVFDTQIAAGFAGLRAQMGYEALVHETLGKRIAKAASFTRWDTRPLTDEQRDYAAGDVADLLAVADELKRRLTALGRLDWALQECRYFETVDDRRDIDTLLGRLPKGNSLDGRQRAVARELLIWRERTAHAADRPPSTILGDATLVELAKRRPRSRERLAQIRGLSAATIDRRGPALLAAIASGREAEPIELPRAPIVAGDPDDAPLVALAEALVRTRAREAGLAYELLASRADLQRIVAAARSGSDPGAVRTISGWRRELIGDELMALLAGRLNVSVDADHRLKISATEA